MQKKKSGWLINILLAVCVIVFLISAFFLGQYMWNSHKAQGEFDDLAHLVEEPETEAPVPESIDPSDPAIPTLPHISPYTTVTNPKTGVEMEILTKYAKAYQQNPDMIGWMKIEGTKVNYPVMQTEKNNKDFYLHRNFKKEYSAHGCFYARELCDVITPSDNVTIYGHNMRDGSMMAALHKYEQKEFWESHPIITFDTLFEHHKYEIFSVFITTATEKKGFAYHTFINAKNEAQYDKFVSRCKELSFYDTDITPSYGDKLITLSTCDYTVENGRLVVVARRITD